MIVSHKKSGLAPACLIALLLASFTRAHCAGVIKPDPSEVWAVESLLDTCITFNSEKTSDKDTQYYADGEWVFPNIATKWVAQASAATGCAVLWRYRDQHPGYMTLAEQQEQPVLFKMAVDALNRQIKDHVNADGSFVDGNTPSTYFFNVELAESYMQLKTGLDADTKQRWLSELRHALDYMTSHGDLPNPALTGIKSYGWYTNGNIELGEAELLYLIFKATGEQRYKDRYETQIEFALAPDQTRWKGFGLQITRAPSAADGSDGAGYLAENGGNGPGFDGDYCNLQATVAARLYIESGDPRILRLENLLVNQLLDHTDQSTWVLDATNGARHSLKFPMFTSGMAVASWLGGRADLAAKLPDWILRALAPDELADATRNWGSANYLANLGTNVGVVLMAAEAAGG